MNTRLKIICILFGIVYFYFIGATIFELIPISISNFKESHKEGYNKVNKKFDDSEKTEVVFFQVKPSSGFRSMPSSVMNLKTGNLIQTEFPIFIAKVNKTQLPQWIKTGNFFFVLLAFPLLFAIIFIPVQIYRVISSIVKNGIFSPKNINRIRWIGYCLLFIFAGDIFSNFISTAEARSLVTLENYRIIFKMDEEYYWLLFALVTLLFAEILKISHTIKEEQDLTI